MKGFRLQDYCPHVLTREDLKDESWPALPSALLAPHLREVTPPPPPLSCFWIAQCCRQCPGGQPTTTKTQGLGFCDLLNNSTDVDTDLIEFTF